jgi:hypothetical protein
MDPDEYNEEPNWEAVREKTGAKWLQHHSSQP